MWNSIQEGCIPEIGKVIAEINVPPLIVADSAFPLRGWLMKPYTDAILTPQQKYFNYRLSRARMVTEGAYGQLKGRWRVLLTKNQLQYSKLGNLLLIVRIPLHIAHQEPIEIVVDFEMACYFA